MYTNVDGIRNKKNLFLERVKKIKPHIIFVTETKLIPSDITLVHFTIEHYVPFRRDRDFVTDDTRGGGVIIFVSDKFCSEQVFLNGLENLKLVVCKIKFGSSILIAACLYRTPSSPVVYNTKLSVGIGLISDISGDQYLLCGDFNYPNIDWTNHLADGNDEIIFYDAVQSAFLHQHVDEFTRKRGTDVPSILDLLLTKNELEIELIDYQSPIGKSDHAVLAFNFTIESEVTIEDEELQKKRYFKGDYIKINKLFQNLFQNSPPEAEVQAKWDSLLHIYKSTTDELIPIGYTNEGEQPRNKWMTRNALQAIHEKENKWHVYRKNKTDANLKIYNDARNESVDIVRQAKYKYEKLIAEEVGNGNVKAFYSYARSLTSIKENVSCVQRPDGSLTNSKKDTANIMNSTFQSVFVREGDGPIPQLNFQFAGPPLEDVNFTVNDVQYILSHLKETSAPGPDSIHPKVLKECADCLAIPLFDIYRVSIDSGIIPTDWSTAHVSPIYKKGIIKSDPLNYRPINLTSVPCKVLENII